jgi:1-acyl-sn-glycerol-3-phosphate acyltransferase
MLRPTREQLALLGVTERLCFEAVDAVHRTPRIQAVVRPFQQVVGRGWVSAATGRLRRVHGLEHLRDLDPDRGVLFASNHRSFFDFYAATAVIYENAPWVTRIFFPVRSTFFYDGPLGVFVNAVMSGFAMFPPVVRSEPKRAWNRFTTDFVVEALATRGTIVGFHPEGSRSKGDDPYTLLPVQPGIGAILRRARPIVIPVFTLGLVNDFVRQIRGNFDGTGTPFTMVFGPPMDLGRYDAMPDEADTWRQIATQVRDDLTALGQVERAFRAREGLPAHGVADARRGADA